MYQDVKDFVRCGLRKITFKVDLCPFFLISDI